MPIEIIDEQLSRLRQLTFFLQRITGERTCAVGRWMRGKGFDAARQLGQGFVGLAERQQGLAQSHESFWLTLLRILTQQVAIDGSGLLVALAAQIVAGGLGEIVEVVTRGDAQSRQLAAGRSRFAPMLSGLSLRNGDELRLV